MNFRIKTLRRLLVIAVVGLVLIAAIFGVRKFNDSRRQARRMAERASGMAAYQQGDYSAALEHFSNYIRKDTADPEAMFAFATARSKVELPNGRHLQQAIAMFEMLRSAQPDDPPTQESLLGLYTQAGYSAEAITLAETVLKSRPKDLSALRAQAIALFRTGKYDAALKASLALNDAAPGNLSDQLQTYTLLRKTQTPQALIVQRYEKLLAEHPDDPRFELLLGVACGDSGDRERGLSLLRSAARRPAPDASFVAQLTQILDQQRLFDESQELLQRSATQSTDPAVLRILAQRLWQNGRYADVVQRLANVDPASPTSDSALIAFTALSQFSLGHVDQCRGLTDALKKRAGDNAAAAWASALQARIDALTTPLPQLVTKYQAALSRGGDNGIVRMWLGDVHLKLGDVDQAIRQWRQSAALMPSWSAPQIAIARAELSRGNAVAAAEAAEAAVRCSQDGAAVSTWALARYALWRQNPTPQEEQKLATMLAAIQRANPGEPETLPLHASLLCRAGNKDQARTAIEAALPQSSGWPPETLANLVSVSREYGLELETKLLNATRNAAQKSPAMALRHALETAAGGHTADALAELQDGVSRAASDQALAWQIALAQFREATHDSEAAATWKALGDAHPEDIAVQSLILRNAPSARADREFYSKTIDRARRLSGEDAALWRYARVRLLLSGQPTQQDSAEAIGHLAQLIRLAPGAPEYRVLLAQAQENLGNTKDAADQLQAAVDIDPRSSSVQIELVRLLQELGRYTDAAKYLDRMAGDANLELSQRLPVAELLAAQGKNQQAVTVLESAATRDQAADLLLARLYRKTSRPDRAATIYSRWLESADATPEAIAGAADFFAEQGDVARGRKTLGQLDSSRLSASQRQTILARFEDRHGGTDAARAHLAAATQQAPHDPLLWRNLAVFHLRHGQYEPALAAIDAGLQETSAAEELATLKLEVQAMQRVAQDPTDLAPLIDVLARDPARKQQADALRALRDLRSSTQPAGAQVARIRQAADQFPQFLPLQALAAQAHLRAGQADQAVAIAYRLIDNFGGDENALSAAVEIFRQVGQWGAMAQAARQWKQVAQNDRPAADTALAEALLRSGRPSDAIATLGARLAAFSAAPENNLRGLEIGARAQIASGQTDPAADLLKPLLETSAGVRGIWMELAADAIGDPQVAAAWLATVQKLIDASSKSESLAFARNSVAAAMRLGTAAPLEPALACVQRFAAGDDADVEAMFLVASIRLQQDRLDDAATAYRALLARQPEYPAALNDLAWVLLLKQSELTEARGLARRAVAASPNVATYHETLARIEAELGNTAAALAEFDATLRLAPSSVDALIGKAFVLRRAGQAGQARRVLSQAEPLISQASAMPEIVKKQLRQLRDELSRGAE